MDYYKIESGRKFLKKRYEIVKLLGYGGYSIVVSAIDHQTKEDVAIKIFRSGSYYKKKCIEEINIHKYLSKRFKKGIKETIHMLGHFSIQKHECLVLELCYRDLFNELRINNKNGFNLQIVKTIITGVLKGLKQLHHVNITHGDVKCDNIAFVRESSHEIKLLDLGNCLSGVQPFKEYNQGRYYRAPEVMLRLSIGSGVDIWALGCVAFEIATGNVLFKGETGEDQIVRVMEVLGVPPSTLIQSSSAAEKYFHENGRPKYCTVKRGDSFKELRTGKSTTGANRKLPGEENPYFTLRQRSPSLVDFIQKCLTWEVNQRMTAANALKHEWITGK